MDLRQTKEYAEHMESQGWIAEKVGGVRVYLKKLGPVGVMKMQRFRGKIDWRKIDAIKKENRVIYTIAEPFDSDQLSELSDQGYKPMKSPYLPTKTVVVDLRKSEQKILMEMKKDARQKIKKENGIEIKKVGNSDLQKFWEGWGKQKKGYRPGWQNLIKIVEIFGDKCLVLGAYDSRFATLSGGVVVLFSDDTAYYYFAWTNSEGRDKGAQYKLVWKGIKEAKKRKMKWWDFEGITDQRWPRKSWEGFSLFKKKFGGEIKTLPGCYRKWF